MDKNTTSDSTSSTKKRWGIVHWLIVGVVLILGFALVVARLHEVKNRVYHQGICFDCRNIANVLHRYAAEHGGNYPDGITSNDALRELFNEGGMSQMIQDERQFAKEAHFTPYKADNDIGIAPSFDKALQKNENHWAMTKGVNNASPGSIPLLFENPAVASWPPYWNVAEANKRVPGRALKVPTVVSATTGNYEGAVAGKSLSGYSIFIARKDGSVSNEELGASNGTIATVAPDATGKNVFEQAGPHEVLDVAKGLAPLVAENRQPIPPPLQKGFQREVFQSSRNPTSKITLISDSECEMESKQGIIIASYANEGKRMRFVFTAFGSQRVSYADIYSNGIKMTSEGVFRKGEVLLNADGMRMQEEEDRVAEAEQQRINLEAPKILIGLWRQSEDPPGKQGMDGIMFKADGTWASIDWQRNEASAKGHWHVENGDLFKGLFNVGTFRSGKILELTQDNFTLEKSDRTKIIATRVIDGAAGTKEEPHGQKQPSTIEVEEKKWRKLIVGGWKHHRRYSQYFEDGRYVHHPRSGGQDENGKWQINGGILIHSPDGGQSYSPKIVSLDVEELVLDFGPGEPNLYFSRAEDAAPGGQMSPAQPQAGEGTSIDPPAQGGDWDSACEVFRERLVTAKEVSKWNFEQLRYAINFLYAKHGYVSRAAEVQAVFSSKAWYRANPGASMDDIDARMSATEATNVKVLAEARSRLKAAATDTANLIYRYATGEIKRNKYNEQKVRLDAGRGRTEPLAADDFTGPDQPIRTNHSLQPAIPPLTLLPGDYTYTPPPQYEYVYGPVHRPGGGYTPQPQQVYVQGPTHNPGGGYTPQPQQVYTYGPAHNPGGGYSPQPQQVYVQGQEHNPSGGYTPPPQPAYVQNSVSKSGGGSHAQAQPTPQSRARSNSDSDDPGDYIYGYDGSRQKRTEALTKQMSAQGDNLASGTQAGVDTIEGAVHAVTAPDLWTRIKGAYDMVSNAPTAAKGVKDNVKAIVKASPQNTGLGWQPMKAAPLPKH